MASIYMASRNGRSMFPERNLALMQEDANAFRYALRALTRSAREIKMGSHRSRVAHHPLLARRLS